MTDFANSQSIVDAIQDLTRVTIALQGNFASKSDAIRRLSDLSIPPARIAAILAMPAGDVHSALAKAKKRVVDDRAPRAQGRDSRVAADGKIGGGNGEG
jgi:DNA-directed RNA polymerase specialized sigma24 family protein